MVLIKKRVFTLPCPLFFDYFSIQNISNVPGPSPGRGPPRAVDAAGGGAAHPGRPADHRRRHHVALRTLTTGHLIIIIIAFL